MAVEDPTWRSQAHRDLPSQGTARLLGFPASLRGWHQRGVCTCGRVRRELAGRVQCMYWPAEENLTSTTTSVHFGGNFIFPD
jgi:hypothetical protein